MATLPQRDDVTQILIEWERGDRDAPERLMPLVYDDLRAIARSYLQRERADHTLQATGLVHEAYLRLVDQTSVGWQNRAHFVSVAAKVMRHFLVDHARARQASKRGGVRDKIEFDEALAPAEERAVDLVALDDARRELDAFDKRKSRIVELRFFGGLTTEEIGEVLDLSPRTIRREWRIAKAWLRRSLMESGSDGAAAG